MTPNVYHTPHQLPHLQNLLFALIIFHSYTDARNTNRNLVANKNSNGKFCWSMASH